MPWPKGLSEPPSWEKRAEFFVSLSKPREEIEATKLASSTGIPIEGLRKLAESEGVPLHEAMNGLIMASRALIDLSTGEKLSAVRSQLLEHTLTACAQHGIKLAGAWDRLMAGRSDMTTSALAEHKQKVQRLQQFLAGTKEMAGAAWNRTKQNLPYGAAGALAGAALLGGKSLRDTSGRDESGLTRGQREARALQQQFEATPGRMPLTGARDILTGAVNNNVAQPLAEAVLERTTPEGFARKTTGAKIQLQNTLADAAAEHPIAAALTNAAGGAIGGFGTGTMAGSMGRALGLIGKETSK